MVVAAAVSSAVVVVVAGEVVVVAAEVVVVAAEVVVVVAAEVVVVVAAEVVVVVVAAEVVVVVAAEVVVVVAAEVVVVVAAEVVVVVAAEVVTFAVISAEISETPGIVSVSTVSGANIASVFTMLYAAEESFVNVPAAAIPESAVTLVAETNVSADIKAAVLLSISLLVFIKPTYPFIK